MTPALPLDEAGQYVAAAYLVFLVVLLVYLAIMSSRLRRIERQMSEVEAERERTGNRGG